MAGERDLLSLNQQRAAVNVLIEIAGGYRINGNGNAQKMWRDELMSKARAWLAENEISWQRGPV